MLKDITERQDIELLVDNFYAKVRKEPNIGPIFEHMIGRHWDKHLAKMYKFWSTILLNEESYQGNPMAQHVKINNRFPLSEEKFSIWYTLWEETIRENFQGAKAEEALERATTIKTTMIRHVLTDELPLFMQFAQPK